MQKQRANIEYRAKETKNRQDNSKLDVIGNKQKANQSQKLCRLRKKFGDFTELYFKNFPTNGFDRVELTNLLMNFEISKALMYEHVGFVKFKIHDDAKRAIKSLDNSKVGENNIEVTPKNPFN